MENFVFSWVYSLLVSGCICSFFLFIVPEGRIRALMEFGCSCVMLLALLTPLCQLDLEEYGASLAEFQQSLKLQEDLNRELAENLTKELIEQEYAEYILTEANRQQIGVESVKVTAVEHEDGVWLPYEAIYTSAAPVPEPFLNYITRELGIAKERQRIYENSEPDQSIIY